MKKYASIGAILTLATTMAFAAPMLTSAATTPGQTTSGYGSSGKPGMGFGRGGAMKPVVIGQVSAINGNTLTVTGKQGFGTSSPSTTFTIDATDAKIMKNNHWYKCSSHNDS